MTSTARHCTQLGQIPLGDADVSKEIAAAIYLERGCLAVREIGAE